MSGSRMPSRHGAEAGDGAFGRLVKGACNAVALDALQAMSTSSPGWCQVAWVHGPVGSGKSAALAAAGSGHVVPCEEWANGWIQSLQDGTVAWYRSRYHRPGTVHAFDDLEFLQGRPKVQREFESMLDRILMAGGRVAMSARTPADRLDLSPRLRSFLAQAFVARLDPPGVDVVDGLVTRAADHASVVLEQGTRDRFAARRWGSIRDVVGAITAMIASITLARLPQAQAAAAACTPPWRPPAPEAVLGAVADAFGVSCRDVTSQSRRPAATVARHVAMAVLHEECRLAKAEVARLMGMDHTSVIYGITRVLAKRDMEPWHLAAAESVRDRIARGLVA